VTGKLASLKWSSQRTFSDLGFDSFIVSDIGDAATLHTGMPPQYLIIVALVVTHKSIPCRKSLPA
jgi:hypothetical protein